MFRGIIFRRQDLVSEKAGWANNLIWFGSLALTAAGVLLMGFAIYSAVHPISQQVASSEIVSAPSNVSITRVGKANASQPQIANVPLSAADMEIYDEVLKLIHQGGQPKRGYDMLADLAKRNPKSGYPYAGLADLKFSLERNYKDAYTLAQRAIKLDPNIPDAYVVITKVSIEHGRPLEAKNAAQKAIALAPDKPEAMFAMARASEKWAEAGIREGWTAASQAQYGVPDQLYAEAERWYRKAIDTYKDNSRKSNIYYWLGNMLSNKYPADIAGATEAFTKSAELSFDNLPWNLNYAAEFLIENTNRYDQAIGYLEQALKLQDFDEARVNLGLAEYYKWGDWKRNPGKYKNSRTKPLSPEEITAQTGVTPDYAFVMNSDVVSSDAAIALLKNGYIKNVDILPEGINNTALVHVASAQSNHVELAKLLISKRANVNFVDKTSQFTPLFWATRRNNLKIVKLLVENGARLNVVDSRGTPLIDYALSKRQISAKPAPILLNYLLQHGADPTFPDRHGFTPLVLAVNWNDVEAVRLLVNKYHAEVNTYIPGKRSSLLESANTPEITEILLKAGANPWVKGMDDVDLVAKAMSPLNGRNPDWPEIKKSVALILEARKHHPKPKDFGQEYQGEFGWPQ